DGMPLRLLLTFAGVLIAPRLRGGDPQIDHRRARIGPSHFRITAEIAHEDDFVDATGHGSTPSLRLQLRAMLVRCGRFVAGTLVNPQIFAVQKQSTTTLSCSRYVLTTRAAWQALKARKDSGVPQAGRSSQRAAAEPIERQDLVDIEIALPRVALLALEPG